MMMIIIIIAPMTMAKVRRKKVKAQIVQGETSSSTVLLIDSKACRARKMRRYRSESQVESRSCPDENLNYINIDNSYTHTYQH